VLFRSFMIMRKEWLQYRQDVLRKEFVPGIMFPQKARLDNTSAKKLKSLGYLQ
jgi:hypothetical protein